MESIFWVISNKRILILSFYIMNMSFIFLFSRNNVLHPHALFNQHKSHNTFQNISHLYQGKNSQHMKPCEAAEAVCDRHTDTPHKHAVKQEGDDCFSTGAQGEISRMKKSILWHKDCHDHNKIFRQFSGILIGIVQSREKWCHY